MGHNLGYIEEYMAIILQNKMLKLIYEILFNILKYYKKFRKGG